MVGIDNLELMQRTLDLAHSLAESIQNDLLFRGVHFEEVVILGWDDPIVARDLEQGLHSTSIEVRGIDNGFTPVHDQRIHQREDGTGHVRATFPSASELKARGSQPRMYSAHDGMGIKLSYTYLYATPNVEIDRNNAQNLGWNIGTDWEQRIVKDNAMSRYFGKAVLSGQWSVAFQIIPEIGKFTDAWEVSIRYPITKYFVYSVPS